MTTLTLNRNLDAFDFSLVTLNDSFYDDWKASQSVDSTFADLNTKAESDKTVSEKVKKFFSIFR